MIQQTNHRAQGFTLIELMLSMTFVAVLLLTIALTVVQMGTIYNRGMTLKEVNQSARDMADDLRRSVQATGVFAVDPSGGDTTDLIRLKRSVAGVEVPVTGRLCLGNYSYLWNTATAPEADRVKYLNASGAPGAPVTFVKVIDTGKKYCAKDTSGALVNKHIVAADSTQSTELLKQGDRNLRVFAFDITTTASSYDPVSGQRLYQVSYTLGTGEVSSMVVTAGIPTACLPPSNPNATPAYCNVQQFAIVLRAGNTVN